MKDFNKGEFKTVERNYLSAIFFLFGLSIMSLTPITPGLKANLNINNGTFGTLLNAASLGSIIMLLIGGQIVHRIGAKRSLRIGSTTVSLTYTLGDFRFNSFYQYGKALTSAEVLSLYNATKGCKR